MEWIAKIIEFFKSAHVDVWVVVLLLCVEAFLGATTLVKPGSSLALALAGVKKVLEFVKGIFVKKVA
jgi:hypothetical protein